MPIVPQEDLKGTFSGAVNILGNGPSLKKARLDSTSPCIGINRSWKIRPALIHCFMDVKQFSTLMAGHLHKSRYIMLPPNMEWRIHKDWYRNFPYQDIVFFDDKAGFGGLYAIHLAKYLGFDTLFLHGYDGTDYLGSFEDFDSQAALRIEGQYPALKWESEQQAVDRVRIYNCNPDSDIPYFEKIRL